MPVLGLDMEHYATAPYIMTRIREMGKGKGGGVRRFKSFIRSWRSKVGNSSNDTTTKKTVIKRDVGPVFKKGDRVFINKRSASLQDRKDPTPYFSIILPKLIDASIGKPTVYRVEGDWLYLYAGIYAWSREGGLRVHKKSAKLL